MRCNILPTREEAEKFNPGPWGNHSRIAAHCAEEIAEECGDMDVKKAYIVALLHDIGRKFGIKHFAHISDGYKYMMSLGCDEVAKICFTHSFNNKTTDKYIGNFDTSEVDLNLVKDELERVEFDDYDYLIQLCDAISGGDSILDIEQRMLDVKKRYGEYPQAKQDNNIYLRKYFEHKMQRDLYEVIEKDTFTIYK